MRKIALWSLAGFVLFAAAPRAVTPAERLIFVLQMDGQLRPNEIEIGRDNFMPREAPLVVILRQGALLKCVIS